jgi:hypothetical protein
MYLLLLLPGLVLAQQKEQKIGAPIHKVTVFFAGAQVEHSKQVNLSAGKQVVVFEKLTDFVDPNSIQLKSTENATILSVRTRKNFDEVAIRKQDVDALNVKRKKLDAEERKLRDEYSVLLYDEQLLQRNNSFGSQQQGVKVSELKEASAFYHSKLTEIQARKSQLEDEIEKVIRAINTIEQEINTRRSLPVKNYTEIEVELDVERPGQTSFEFSYITPNASWKPYYDMRSSGIGAPVLLEAKGLVTQDTGEDWNNVTLVLSTNDPYDNTQEPAIEPWYLNYYTPAPRKTTVARTAVQAYDYSGETIYGEAMDATTGEPLSFAKIQMANNPNVIFPTDINGRYSFVVPRGETGFTVSYLGYDDQYVQIRAPFTKVLLKPQAVELDEVVVSKYAEDGYFNDNAAAETYNWDSKELNEVSITSGGRKGKRKRNENLAGIVSSGYGTYDVSAKPLAEAVQKDLRMEFQINTPFTIPSDNADHRVAIAVYDMKANYEYHTVPKLDASVYLVAQISGWEKLNLLNGESNLYFDGTFIGKSYVNVDSAKDTLSFSLGKDKKIVVERKRSEEKSKTRAIGNRTKYEVQWDFTVRNNGSASIPFILKDHFPIATNDDIKVKQGEYPGAGLDEKTGILTWRMNLNKGETRTLFFNYSVEYSNGQPIYLE